LFNLERRRRGRVPFRGGIVLESPRMGLRVRHGVVQCARQGRMGDELKLSRRIIVAGAFVAAPRAARARVALIGALSARLRRR